MKIFETLELETIAANAARETAKVKSKLERDKKEVYYIDVLLGNPMQENPLNHAYAINEVYDKMTNFNVYHIVEWDAASFGGIWVWSSESLGFPFKAEERVKELNQEHKELTSKL